MLNIINSKLQIKTTMKYHYTSTNMAPSPKKTKRENNVEQLELSYVFLGGGVKSQTTT